MPEPCAATSPLARKIASEILRRLASLGQVHVGEAIGKSETWVSRWKGDDLESCAALLAVLGLKCVPTEHVCYAPDYIDHLRYFARIGMAQEQPQIIDWDHGEREE